MSGNRMVFHLNKTTLPIAHARFLELGFSKPSKANVRPLVWLPCST
jgi:hypothetical protein